MTPDNIASGWRKTGIIPWDPNIILNLFNTKQEPVLEDAERPTSSRSDGAELGPGDWKSIKKRLRKMVINLIDLKVDNVEREKAVLEVIKKL
ncbi:uncharacterized protein BDZ99DRAFT_528614 [Mytilinidion resinicola]|uniref:Uncharacterized protein n=1 Tax=Mytilinidion resinicola TaxID=574789 RepID=A0A6A6XXY2_9PEZI|nr:uncharacterized protein BDZ99DRAFT_528614 [Mytilinidion resinicola]KAF2801239.1 hypothetical protein BDZ99DRAFT_528614 [Mytilinidion resinicola]